MVTHVDPHAWSEHTAPHQRSAVSRKIMLMAPLTTCVLVLAIIVISSDIHLEDIAELDVKKLTMWSTVHQTELPQALPAASANGKTELPQALPAASNGKTISPQALSAASGNGTGPVVGEDPMKREVRRCAREITGDDTPRHLEPDVRAKVLDCAAAYMPPMDTEGILRDAEKQLMKSAKTPEQMQDAADAIKQANDPNAPSPPQPASPPAGAPEVVSGTKTLPGAG
mmetsp:Transcript_24501/g.58348  ORF Transcript_24501/g.58348 Transcript_24501/m.58348 type:complete len:227 (+) Transcript_24501:39-719(+)